MHRMTLARALGIVGVLAVGCAAMRAATYEGERLVFALVLGVHALGLLGTILRRARDPAWLGFSLLGGLVFVVITTDWFDGRSGHNSLPISGLAEAAYKIPHPPPEVPIVDGVRLVTEPDKVSASDRALKAFEQHKIRLEEYSERLRHVGAMADLLFSVVAALAGVALGPWLAPVPTPPIPAGEGPDC